MGLRGPYQHQVTLHWVSGVAKTKNRLWGLSGPTVGDLHSRSGTARLTAFA